MSTIAHEPLRVGLIGAGFMGRQHAEYISTNPDSVLAGIADPFTTTVADEYGVPAYTDHRELLAQPGLDAVVIANPNNLHVDTAIDSVRAGVAALLEKPVAPDYREALRLREATEASGVAVLVGQHRRHHPSVAVARGMIRGGELGRLVAVNGMWAARKEDTYFDVEWHRTKGAGVMLINLVHDLDLLRYICGEIVTVQAVVSNEVRGHEVEDTVSVAVRFESGALGSFIATDAAASPWGWDQGTEDFNSFPFLPDNPSYFFAGTNGSLAVPNLEHFFYPTEDANWHHPLARQYREKGTGDSYTRQMAHFVDVVRGTADPVVSVADAAHTLGLIDAAREAGETGGTIVVAEHVARLAEEVRA